MLPTIKDKTLQKEIIEIYTEQKVFLEGYFEELSKQMYITSAEDPSTLVLYRQANLNYFDGSCEAMIAVIKKLKIKSANTSFINTSSSLALDCLVKNKKIKDLKGISKYFTKNGLL